jgi:hypothetical protein
MKNSNDYARPPSDAMQRVVAALRAIGITPKPVKGGYEALCPAHDDTNPSLSINPGDDGRVLIHCHAGCPPESVVASLDLKMSDLMGPDVNSVYETPRGAVKNGGFVDRPRRKQFESLDSAMSEINRRPPDHQYPYHRTGGELVAVVGRWNEPGGKVIRPFTRVGEGWEIGAPPEPRPLFGLRDLGDGRVFVVEGEKCVEAARLLGLNAVTSMGGARAAAKTDWGPLAGREVVILPDEDEAGDEYAECVCDILQALNPPPTVKIVWLEGLDEGEDLADLIERRGDQRDALSRQIEDAVRETPAESEEGAPALCPGYRPFPVHALPPVSREYVTECAKALGCDVALVALPHLAALAAAIGNTHTLRLKSTWSVPAVLWTVVIAPSGTLKSPAVQLAVDPLRRAEDLRSVEHQRACAAYRDEQEAFEEALDRWREDKEDGSRPVEPVPPPNPRLCCSDATTEAVHALLFSNRRGLLLVRDELSGWVASFNQYRKGRGDDVPRWLELNDGGRLTVDRKHGETTQITLRHAGVSIAGGIQPQVFTESMGQRFLDNGLAARLLVAMPPCSRRSWNDDEVGEERRSRIDGVFMALVNLAGEPDEIGQPAPRMLRLAPDAKTHWVEFFDGHNRELDGIASPALRPAFSKLEGICARLALIDHLARAAAGGSPAGDEIGVESLCSAIELVEWFKHEARRVYFLLLGGGGEGIDQHLLGWIEQRGGTARVREITQRYGPLKNKRDAAERACESLVDVGVARWRPSPPGRGRPTRTLELVREAARPGAPEPPAPGGPSGPGREASA